MSTIQFTSFVIPCLSRNFPNFSFSHSFNEILYSFILGSKEKLYFASALSYKETEPIFPVAVLLTLVLSKLPSF